MRRLLTALVLAAACGGAPSGTAVPVAPAVPSEALQAPTAAPAWRWSSPRPTFAPLRAIWAASDVALVVGDRGTVLRSTDGGVSWTASSSGVTAALQAAGGGARGPLFAGGQGSLLRSDDRGVTFGPASLSLASPKTTVTGVWTDTSGHLVIVVGSEGLLARSTDGGATWTPVPVPAGCGSYLRSIRGDDKGRVWIGGSSCLLTSTDAGATFASTPRDNATFGRSWRDGSAMFALLNESQRTSLLRSDDAGATWSAKPRYLGGSSFDGAWGDDVGAVLVGNNGTIVRTLDHGARWLPQARTTEAELQDVAGTHGALLVVGDDGIIRRSTDGGTTFTPANAATDARLTGVWLGDDGTAYAVGACEWDGMSVGVRSSDSGVTWSDMPMPPKAKQAHFVFSPAAGEVLTNMEEVGLVRSHDGGSTWSLPKGDARVFLNGDMCRDASGRLHALRGGGTPVSSSDGATWEGETGFSATALWCAPDGSVFAVGHDGLVAQSTDGHTWSSKRDGKRGSLTGVAGAAGSVVIAGDQGVLRSTDGGATFAPVLPKEQWTTLRAGGGVLVAVSSQGSAARSTDGGATWTREDLHAMLFGAAVNARGDALVVGRGGAIARFDTHGDAPASPAPAPVPAGASAEPSPFQPAADALAAQQAADARTRDALVAELEGKLGPLLHLVARGTGSPSVGPIRLDFTASQLRDTADVSGPSCDWEVIKRYCPARNSTSALAPRSAGLQGRTVEGSFVDGKLFSLRVSTHDGLRAFTADERRSAVAAFEAIATKVFGAPTGVVHDPSSPDDPGPTRSTQMSWFHPGDDAASEPELRVSFSLESGTTLRVAGRSAAVEATLRKKDDELTKIEQAQAAEAARKEACLCKQVKVGSVWPPHFGGAIYSNLDVQYRVLSVSPASCSAHVKDVSGIQVGREYDLPCTQFVEERECAECGVPR